MSRARPLRPHPIARSSVLAASLALVVFAGACSGGGDDAGIPAGSAAETTAPAASAPADDGAVGGGAPDGAEVTEDGGDRTAPPPGYRLVTGPGPGVAVALAVPEAWEVLDLDGDDLADLQGDLADDPQLAGLLAQGGAMLDGAATLAALGPDGGSGRDLAVAVQLGIVLPTGARFGQRLLSGFPGHPSTGRGATSEDRQRRRSLVACAPGA